MRLIDADKFGAVLDNIFDHLYESGKADLAGTLAAFADMVKQQKTVDAVPVVRCKDCKHWGGVAFGNVCRRWSAPLAGMKNCTKPMDYCSYAERKDGKG